MINFETYYVLPFRNNDDKFDIKRNYFEGVFVTLDFKRNFNNIDIRKNKINKFSNGNQKLVNDVMQYILEYKEKYEIEFDIILKDKVYIKFYIKNMFEPALFGNILDKKMVHKYVFIIKFLEGLAEIIEKSK